MDKFVTDEDKLLVLFNRLDETSLIKVDKFVTDDDNPPDLIELDETSIIKLDKVVIDEDKLFSIVIALFISSSKLVTVANPTPIPP